MTAVKILFRAYLLFLTIKCFDGRVSEEEPAAKPVRDPDVFRNISELITSKGYPVEEHDVVTPDGYIIGVQRITEGRSPSNASKDSRPAVLLHHGLFSSGAQHVLNFPDQSLGFVLADAGYDVWITNARGTQYSLRHVSLNPKSKKYWNFSFDEMGLVDLPATIDYILNVTGQEKLFYAGHSMGTTTIFALLSDKPEYNDKVKVVVAMAPAVLMGHTKSPFRLLTKFLKEAETRVPVYLANGIDGTSVHTFVHYGQLILSNKFQKYDFGPKENIRKYNQPTPPEYKVERITAPMALMWGLNDQTSDPVDVSLLAQRLKSLVLNYEVPYPEWSHDDFAIGLDANTFVYSEVLKVFDKFTAA